MKRLQVGDECYVRDSHGDIIKCEYVGEYEGWENIAQSVNNRARRFNLNFLRIVYPYPIIRELAK
jgi:hypothetical protein